jgi:hypothetical protein
MELLTNGDRFSDTDTSYHDSVGRGIPFTVRKHLGEDLDGSVNCCSVIGALLGGAISRTSVCLG